MANLPVVIILLSETLSMNSQTVTFLYTRTQTRMVKPGSAGSPHHNSSLVGCAVRSTLRRSAVCFTFDVTSATCNIAPPPSLCSYRRVLANPPKSGKRRVYYTCACTRRSSQNMMYVSYDWKFSTRIAQFSTRVNTFVVDDKGWRVFICRRHLFMYNVNTTEASQLEVGAARCPCMTTNGQEMYIPAIRKRPEMDDLVFAGSLIEEISQVDKKAECFSHCQWRVRCNQVLYNPLAKKCRLYTEAFGSSSDGAVGTGWQYYGVSCPNYKLENARVDVDVINADPKDVCNTNFIVSDDNTSSCYTGALWEVVPVKCVSCYIGKARPSMVPSEWYVEKLTFDLAAGMKLRLEVSGSTSEFNRVILPSGPDYVYLLSLRWSYTPPQAVFNTMQGGASGSEEVEDGVSVNDISNYIIEVHISESAFMTYVNGTLLMTNQMRLPFTGVRRVIVRGFTALHSLHVGYVLC